MPITPPVVDTEISASAFGIPVANALNRAGISRSGIQATFAAGSYTQLTWNTTSVDTHSFATSDSMITIPAGMEGVYSIAIAMHFTGATTNCYTSIYSPASVRYDFPTTGARMAASLTVPLSVGETVALSLYNGSGAILTSSFSRLFVYRVGI